MLRHKLTYIFFLLFASSFVSLTLHGQILDSLVKILPKQKDDTNKVIMLERINYEKMFDSDVSTRLPYIEAQLKLSEKLNYARGMASAYHYMGDYYRSVYKNDDAFFYMNKADSIYRVIGNQRGIAETNTFFARYYIDIERYEDALVKYLEVLEYYRKIGFLPGEASMYGSIALLFTEMGRHEESEAYFLKSIKIRNEIGDKRGMSVSLLNLGASMYEVEKYDKALLYLNQCLLIQEELQDPHVIAGCQLNIGNIYTEKGQYEDALSMLDNGYNNYELLGDSLMMSYTLMYKSATYRRSGNPDEALSILKKAFVYIEKNTDDELTLGNFYYQFYKCYKDLGKYREALDAYEKNIDHKQNLYSSETADKLSELREKYETEKKEQENLALKKDTEIKDLKLSRQRYIIYAIGGMSVLIIIIFLQRSRNNKIKTEQRTTQLEQQLLRSQMNPHFIFNALISIQSFIYEKEPQEAGKYLSSFSRLMRSILENSRDEYITLSKEILWLENYIELQKLRYENSFDYTLEVDSKIEKDNTLIPPMLSQPFIENAIEHGLSKSDKNGQLHILFKIDGKFLYIEIKDNGVGFSNSGEHEKKEHNSLAVKITKERIELLNLRKKQKILFNIESQPQEGTCVSFRIPLTFKI